MNSTKKQPTTTATSPETRKSLVAEKRFALNSVSDLLIRVNLYEPEEGASYVRPSVAFVVRSERFGTKFTETYWLDLSPNLRGIILDIVSKTLEEDGK